MSADGLTFSLTRSRADYWDGILLHAASSAWTPFVFLAAPTTNALLAFFYSRGDGAEAQVATVAGFFLLSLLAVTALMLPCYWWSARAAWRSPGALRRIDFQINSEGVAAQSEMGAGQTRWPVFDAAFENARQIVLRQRPGLLYIFPKREMKPEEVICLRRLIEQNVTGKIRLRSKEPK